MLQQQLIFENGVGVKNGDKKFGGECVGEEKDSNSQKQQQQFSQGRKHQQQQMSLGGNNSNFNVSGF
jgi:hypothetical protein